MDLYQAYKKDYAICSVRGVIGILVFKRVTTMSNSSKKFKLKYRKKSKTSTDNCLRFKSDYRSVCSTILK